MVHMGRMTIIDNLSDMIYHVIIMRKRLVRFQAISRYQFGRFLSEKLERFNLISQPFKVSPVRVVVLVNATKTIPITTIIVYVKTVLLATIVI